MAKRRAAQLEDSRELCGLVMPISAIDELFPSHWIEVKEILSEAISNAGFRAELVSTSDDSGIIHARIVRNLYENPIVVVDVSAKNPNVMFELGLRLAFDRPTVVVKDDKTNYSFDTSPIEHIAYPRDLRFKRVNEFKIVLAEKVKATFEKAKADPNYSTFLKHFGDLKPSHLQTADVPAFELIQRQLEELKQSISTSNLSGKRTSSPDPYWKDVREDNVEAKFEGSGTNIAGRVDIIANLFTFRAGRSTLAKMQVHELSVPGEGVIRTKKAVYRVEIENIDVTDMAQIQGRIRIFTN